jgi:hypothetical protein
MTNSSDVIAFSVGLSDEITRYVNLFADRPMHSAKEDNGIYEEWFRGP